MKRPQCDSSRRCIPLAEWPAADRSAWLAALSGDPLSWERSRAADWTPSTEYKNRRGYGRWLTFLRNSHADLNSPSADRVTPARIKAYMAELRLHQVSPYTLRNRIGELYAVMIALAPDHDWFWLKNLVARLDRHTEDSAKRKLPPQLIADLFEHCKKQLRRLERLARSPRNALAYRNWLMITMLCALPLRLRNFAALALGQHLNRRGDIWYVDVPATETKTARPFAALIPSDVVRFLDRYLSAIRPMLDRGLGGDRLWLGTSGKPLAPHSISVIITELTRDAFGISINPHQFRHIFATSVSIADPESIEGARATLGHSTFMSTRRHYVHATALTAARTHARIVCQLRDKRRHKRTPSNKLQSIVRSAHHAT